MPHVKIWVLPYTPNILEKRFELDVDPIHYRAELGLTVDGLKEQLVSGWLMC